MDPYLDELLLACPLPGTLARLIFDAAASFENRTWASTRHGKMTYKVADGLSQRVASFFKEAGYHQRSYLYIENDGSVETGIVLMGALKAGMPVVNAKVHPPLIKQNFVENRRLLAFEQLSFTDAQTDTAYREALKRGDDALFFNIPHTGAMDNAFYFFSKDEAGALTACGVNHRQAVSQVYRSKNGRGLHPHLRVVYHWFNGFEAP